MLLLLLYLFSLIALFEAKRPLYRAKDGERNEDTYIVALRDRATHAEKAELLRDLKERNEKERLFTAKIGGVLENTINGFMAVLSHEAVEYVRKSDLVNFVEEDRFVKGAGSSEVRDYSSERPGRFWGLDRLDQEDLPLDQRFRPPCNLTGKGISVYILDTGIRYSHYEFEGRARYPQCDPMSVIEGTSPFGLDTSGHGTHIAGLVGGRSFGVAPGTILYSVRVLNATSHGTICTVMDGLECVLRHHNRSRRAVVNISIFGTYSKAYHLAILRVMKAYIPVVTIAGNANSIGDACRFTPARIGKAITVGASQSDDKVWNGTQIGSCVDLFAPGHRITSSNYASDFADTVRTGTSMAAPYVTGAVALMLERCPRLKPYRLGKMLINKLTVSGKLSFDGSNSGDINLTNLIARTPNVLLNFADMCPNGKWSFRCPRR